MSGAKLVSGTDACCARLGMETPDVLAGARQ